MSKKFVLEVEIQETNTPQNWTFDNINPIEQVAVWMMVKVLAEKKIAEMLGN